MVLTHIPHAVVYVHLDDDDSDAFLYDQVTLLNTSSEELLSCLHCQIKLYQETDILIGVHGAGGWMGPLVLSHAMMQR